MYGKRRRGRDYKLQKQQQAFRFANATVEMRQKIRVRSWRPGCKQTSLNGKYLKERDI
jgi:hypothetical protein